jgi:hypothetical protein
MVNPGPITSFNVQPSLFVNGDINTYLFSVQAVIPVLKGDGLTMKLPVDIGPPTTTTMNCQPRQNIVKMTCTVVDQTIFIVFDEFLSSSGAFSWTI